MTSFTGYCLFGMNNQTHMMNNNNNNNSVYTHNCNTFMIRPHDSNAALMLVLNTYTAGLVNYISWLATFPAVQV